MNSFLSALDSVALVEQSGVPRKALKSLLVGNGLGPGARILVVGGASADLAQCLDGLGLFVTGFEANLLSLTQLRRSAPLADWRGGDPRETACLPDQAFDLVVVRDHPDYRRSLADSEARRTTADLLATLRPAGTFAVLDARHFERAAGRSHAPLCFADHLLGFAGVPIIEEFPEGALARRWLRGGAAEPGTPFALVQWTLPESAITRGEWRTRAEARADATVDCCVAAESRQRRAA